MKKHFMNLAAKSAAIIMAVTMTAAAMPAYGVYAAEEESDPLVVVSLGDSYSSGEGIEPFYGQSKKISVKINDENWLAHRSEKSWGAQLTVPGYEGTMSDYFVDYYDNDEVQWYFKAASGATTSNITKSQTYTVSKFTYNWGKSYEKTIDPQISVFDDIEENTTDYVTMTIGGNDVDFSGIITEAVVGSTYLGTSSLDTKLADIWSNFDTTRNKIQKAYKSVASAAGSQAAIIIAGYPKLLDKEGKGVFFSQEEATTINENVHLFNLEIEALVEKMQAQGMNIYFVDVEEAFDADGGHQAYSDDAWINSVYIGSKDEDLKTFMVASNYSMHPNEKGAEAYAACVNEKIAEIENAKKTGTISGTVVSVADGQTPVTGAEINAYQDGVLMNTVSADENGSYSLQLPVGDYQVVITADGFESYTADVTVSESTDTAMGTILMNLDDSQDAALQSDVNESDVNEADVNEADVNEVDVNEVDVNEADVNASGAAAEGENIADMQADGSESINEAADNNVNAGLEEIEVPEAVLPEEVVTEEEAGEELQDEAADAENAEEQNSGQDVQ